MLSSTIGPAPMTQAPVIAAIDMGYGHLRPAAALANHLGIQVLEMDRPPLGHARDRAFWNPVRNLYYAPTDPARRRIASYGVPLSRIRVTGFPLPGELVGRDRAALKRNFRARMERISRKGRPPLVVFAVGGAGAQVPLAKSVIRGLT